MLQDLVNEKLPRIAQAFVKFEVDLSLFTLSWFITCFIDALPYRVYLKLIDCLLYEQNKVGVDSLRVSLRTVYCTCTWCLGVVSICIGCVEVE